MTVWTELLESTRKISVNRAIQKVEMDLVKDDLKEKVMAYPHGCDDGKVDFLKYLGFEFPLTGRVVGGTLTVTLKIHDSYSANVDYLRKAIGGSLADDSCQAEVEFTHQPSE